MEIPPIDPRTREDLYQELRLSCRKAFGGEQPALEPGSLLDALLFLYARMLDETRVRLNRVPEKHRLAFLNLMPQHRLPAHPGEAVFVFAVTDGCTTPVEIPEGTLIEAEPSGRESVLFRTKRSFRALPSRLTDICWCDEKNDQVVFAFEASEETPVPAPFSVWSGASSVRGRHLAGFVFDRVFLCTNGGRTFRVTATLKQSGKPVCISVLANPKMFLWGLEPIETEAARFQIRSVAFDGGGVLLTVDAPPDAPSSAVLRLELLEKAYVGLVIENLRVCALEYDAPPDAVLSGKNALAPSAFYPFGEVLEPYSTCYLFCEKALGAFGAEITLRFDLELETAEVFPEEELTQIDYKWIMRKPMPKPEPRIYQAFAQALCLDYWNGSEYCAVPFQDAPPQAFQEQDGHFSLSFSLPADFARDNCGDRTGYALRLSCGACDALYKLPRRVFTPVIKNLSFSCWVQTPASPSKAFGINFGETVPTSLQKAAPFHPPPEKRALLLGFDWLPPCEALRLFFQIQNQEWVDGPSPRVRLCGSNQELCVEDETGGLRRNGILTVFLPEAPKPATLLGRTRYWLCISGESNGRLDLTCVAVNAERAVNRVRHKQYFSAPAIPLDGTLQLAHGSIVKAWFFVRVEGEWVQWEETGQDRNDLGFYTLDYRTGLLQLPTQFCSLCGGDEGQDLAAAVYDTTDGENGNIPSGEACRLQEEIPFIAAVKHPLPVVNGWESETDRQLASRLEHKLYSGGRVVSINDYEQFVKDACPLVCDARCLPGSPVRIAVLLKEPNLAPSFAEIREALRHSLYTATGDTVQVRLAVPVTFYCKLFLSPEGIKNAPELPAQLSAYLNPVTGGYRKEGWKIGCLPSYEQLEAFVCSILPPETLLKMEVMAMGSGLKGNWRALKPGPFHVPGPVEIQWEVL